MPRPRLCALPLPIGVLVIAALSLLLGAIWCAAAAGSLALLPDYGNADLMKSVPLAQAREQYRAGTSVFMDSRSAQEYSEGHIAGAIGMSIATRRQKLPDLKNSVPRWTQIIVYCNGGTCESAGALASWLGENGWPRVAVLTEGFPAWVLAGYEVDQGESPQ